MSFRWRSSATCPRYGNFSTDIIYDMLLDSDTGSDYALIPEVYVVYISEFDIFEKKRTVYHVESVIKETGDVIDDGLHRIFVNTNVHDGTDIADYMRHFRETGFEDPKFPCFTKAMKALKETEGGQESMCKIMEEYAKEYAKEATVDAFISAALKYNATPEQIAQDLTERYEIDSSEALKRIDEFKKQTEIV